ncbi:hypothetical protein DPMN_080086 [Dreissena polymorpha]|uniref:Uncharacterized protein n=1 Tax=Dreissena polymorpha TaxID=45954 RepID=A0A9D3YT94_DREPO|nr:hypothetical protein DPMN_080086 [Dreissena polymorpha]
MTTATRWRNLSSRAPCRILPASSRLPISADPLTATSPMGSAVGHFPATTSASTGTTTRATGRSATATGAIVEMTRDGYK